MSSCRRALMALSAAASLCAVRADERFFTYVYEADVLPVGRWEFEQWLTYRQGEAEGNPQLDQTIWDFREEIEYSPLQGLSTSLYFNFRQNTITANGPGLDSSSEFSFKGVSGEVKYQLLSPIRDPIGVALYVEPTYNGSEYEIEEKLILSKFIGDHWVLGANASVEQEWEEEDGSTEKESVLEFTAGVAYRWTSHWSSGVEGRYHSVYEGIGFHNRLGAAWFVGPNIHYGAARWWATLTGMPQIAGNVPGTDASLDRVEHQNFEIRLLFGVSF